MATTKPSEGEQPAEGTQAESVLWGDEDPAESHSSVETSGASDPGPADGADAEVPVSTAPTSAGGGAGNMWDMVGLWEENDRDDDFLADLGIAERPAGDSVVAPFPGPAARAVPSTDPASSVAADQPVRRTGRVKTRLLGFEHSTGETTDVAESTRDAASPRNVQFPVGWVVVVGGPGRGAAIPLRMGVSQIGRAEDQAIQLDFGDTSISRENHASIAFDDETRKFYIGHGGKSNLVRVNNRPLLSTETVSSGDEIRIGQTTLRLVALCGEGFSWSESAGQTLTANG